MHWLHDPGDPYNQWAIKPKYWSYGVKGLKCSTNFVLVIEFKKLSDVSFLYLCPIIDCFCLSAGKFAWISCGNWKPFKFISKLTESIKILCSAKFLVISYLLPHDWNCWGGGGVEVEQSYQWVRNVSEVKPEKCLYI